MTSTLVHLEPGLDAHPGPHTSSSASTELSFCHSPTSSVLFHLLRVHSPSGSAFPQLCHGLVALETFSLQWSSNHKGPEYGTGPSHVLDPGAQLAPPPPEHQLLPLLTAHKQSPWPDPSALDIHAPVARVCQPHTLESHSIFVLSNDLIHLLLTCHAPELPATSIWNLRFKGGIQHSSNEYMQL